MGWSKVGFLPHDNEILVEFLISHVLKSRVNEMFLSNLYLGGIADGVFVGLLDRSLDRI